MGTHLSLSTRTRHGSTLYFVALLREELGRRIKIARNEKGFSQQELAELVGLKHAQDISRYERGLTEVPDFRIDRIAEATGQPRSYFMRDPAEPEPAKNLDERLDRLEALLRRVADALGVDQQ
jgi:transcriptional regulator with XRE-family HTH domain